MISNSGLYPYVKQKASCYEEPRKFQHCTVWLIVQWALSINTSRLVCPAYLSLNSIDFILSHKTILDSHIQQGSCAKDSNRRIPLPCMYLRPRCHLLLCRIPDDRQSQLRHLRGNLPSASPPRHPVNQQKEKIAPTTTMLIKRVLSLDMSF